MDYRFTSAYKDLGDLHEGDRVRVTLRGPAAKLANVLLLDHPNFWRYRGGSSFRYVGGTAHRTDVQLEVPRDGHWYVAMDLGGRSGRVQGAVSVEHAPE
jgi:hypothetical protein